MKKLLLLILTILNINFSFAQENMFTQKTWGVLYNLDQLNINNYYDYYKKELKKPYKQEAGAIWFKANGKTFFSESIEDVFISDNTSNWIFIGIVVLNNPDKVFENIKNIPGARFWKKDKNEKYSPYISNAGTEILWFGENKSKIVYKLHVGPKSKYNNWLYFDKI